jgi:DNA recombination protein Rad52
MAFAPTQLRKLKSKLKAAHIKTREADGNMLHYVEGWHVVAEANRIFGFDGWDRESVSSTCVWTKQTGLRFSAAYVTRVRITVRAGEERIVREGCGAGESNAASPGQAHEFAAKAAETDATKRALSTFGNSFGLSLYAGLSDQNGKKAIRSDRSQVEAERRPGNAPAPGNHDSGVQLPENLLAPLVAEEAPPGAGRQPIDKSLLAIPEIRRLRDKEHLRFVATHPCIVCGRQPTVAHHLKFSQPSALGRKVSDAFTVPMCALHHRDLHTTGNELAWWERKKIEPLPIANDLWDRSRRGGGAEGDADASPEGVSEGAGAALADQL